MQELEGLIKNQYGSISEAGRQSGTSFDQISSWIKCGCLVDSSGQVFKSQGNLYKNREERKTINPKADDIISVEMTALEACKLRTLMAHVRGGDGNLLHSNLEGKFKHYIKDIDLESSRNWYNSSALHKAALAQFKDPK